MRRILAATLLTTAISSVAIALATAPACAQMYGMDQADSVISLDYFSDQLAPYGYWLYSDRWGLVWQPANVSYDFHPYFTAGHWIYTDEYGWYWQSQFPWGDIPFHYGRWVNDPDDGWLWIPGYVWSPGWVTWRSNGQYIGWMPMPPDDAFLEGRGDMGVGGIGLSFRFGLGQIGGLYGYSRWYGPRYNESLFAQNWVFVGFGQIASPSYRGVAITNPAQVVNLIHQTRNVTNYTVVNNYVVNRSVDVRAVERAAGHPVPAVPAVTIIRHPGLVATVTAGQRAQMRMRAIAPRGTGIADSAPPPPPRVVAKLSTRVPPPKPGHAPVHLFTRATVTAPEARTRFRGGPPPASGPATVPGGMPGPNGAPPAMQPPGSMPGSAGFRPRPQQPNGMAGPNGGPPPKAGPGGGMAGPNGGPPPAQQPGGMTSSPVERPRPQRPNGPNGGPSPNAAPSGGMTGSNGGPPTAQRPGGGGPNIERPRVPPIRPQGTPPHPPARKPPPQNPPQ